MSAPLSGAKTVPGEEPRGRPRAADHGRRAAGRFALGRGRTFALYVAAYTAGRFWTEYLRIDEVHTRLRLRRNNWTSVVVLLGAIACLVVSARRHPGIEDVARPKDEGRYERAGEPRPDVAIEAGGAARDDRWDRRCHHGPGSPGSPGAACRVRADAGLFRLMDEPALRNAVGDAEIT